MVETIKLDVCGDFNFDATLGVNEEITVIASIVETSNIKLNVKIGAKHKQQP